MRIAVLGGGHGCYAAAADLSEQGHEVRLWRRNSADLAPVIENGSITLKDIAGSRDVPISLATADIGEAVRGAELIVVPLPAFAQRDIAKAMAPHLSDGQVIYMPPGTFGSYVMARVIRDCGQQADLSFAETGTLPYLARKHGPREIAITIRATRLPTGVFPAKNSGHAFDILKQAYPSVEPIEDALSGALMNAGPIIHPPLIIMNAGPLEHFPEWDIHNEGTQPSIRHVTTALDEERMAVRVALGYSTEHFPLSDHYESDRWMYGDAHKALVDSGDWREDIDLTSHRYMIEDLAMGLAFLVSVAKWVGVPTPISEGLLAMGSAICNTNFRDGERTLEALNLASLDGPRLKQLLAEGLE